MAAKYITELLKDINDNPSLLTNDMRRRGAGDTFISLLLEAAYDPEKRFILPTTRPPFRPNQKPLGLCESSIRAEISRFYLYRNTKDFTKGKRELLFVQALERVSAEEAEVLLAIKEQNLQRLYPNITPQLVCDAGYIPQSAVRDYVAPVVEEAEETPVRLQNVPVVAAEDLGNALLGGLVRVAPSEPVVIPAGASLKEQARLFYEASPDKSKPVVMDYMMNTLGLKKNVANNYFYAVKKEYDSKNQSAPLGA